MYELVPVFQTFRSICRVTKFGPSGGSDVRIYPRIWSFLRLLKRVNFNFSSLVNVTHEVSSWCFSQTDLASVLI